MNREVHVRIWERSEVKVLRATRHFAQFPPANLSDGCGVSKQTLAGAYGNDEVAPIPTFPRPWSNSRPVHRLRNELEAA